MNGIPTHLETPNHVSVNHLLCRSLENGMVITASTTRYNEKFVTTLYYNYNPKKKDLYVCLHGNVLISSLHKQTHQKNKRLKPLPLQQSPNS